VHPCTVQALREERSPPILGSSRGHVQWRMARCPKYRWETGISTLAAVHTAIEILRADSALLLDRGGTGGRPVRGHAHYGRGVVGKSPFPLGSPVDGGPMAGSEQEQGSQPRAAPPTAARQRVAGVMMPPPHARRGAVHSEDVVCKLARGGIRVPPSFPPAIGIVGAG